MHFTIHRSALLSLILGLILIHCLIGGSRPVFSLPTFALIGIAGLLAFRSPILPEKKSPTACTIAASLLFSYLFVRGLFSPVPYLARADLFLLLSCLLVYFLAAGPLSSTTSRVSVIKILLCLGVIHAGVSAIQAAFGEDFMLFGIGRAPNDSRASGLFVSPNHLAGFLEIALAFGISFTLSSTEKPAMKVAFGYASLCCAIALLLSQSRGGFACAVFSLLIWCLLNVCTSYLKNPRQLKRAVLFSSIALASICAIGLYLITEHHELRDRLATSLSHDIRLANWQTALTQFSTSPIFGTGSGTHLYLGRLYRQPELQLDPVHAHSDYLELLAEYGVIGGLCFLAFLFTHAKNSLQSLRHLALTAPNPDHPQGNNLALLLGSLTAFAAIAAHSLVDFNLHIPANALAVAFFFGILAQPQPPNLTPQTTSTQNTKSRLLLLPFLSLALLLGSLLAYPGEFFSEQSRIRLREFDYPNSILYAQQSIRLDPWNPFTFTYLGEAYRVQAEEEESYDDRQSARQQANLAYQSGLRLFPQDTTLLLRRAQVLDRLRLFDQAEASFQLAIAADPRLSSIRQAHSAHQLLQSASQAQSNPPK
ncbi:MAG: O-antigen ligase family protein [Verrucomicrobiota bacterium]